MPYAKVVATAACIITGITIATVAAPATQPATGPAAATQPANAASPRRVLGIVVEDLNTRQGPGNAALIDQLGGNLVVNAVRAKSRAEELGLKQRDVIKRVNGQDVTTVKEIIDAVQKGKLLEIEILRDKRPLTLREQPSVS